MVATISPSNLDELLSFVSNLVQENCTRGEGHGTDGAVLAREIRQRYPGFEYSQFSMTRLADLVHEAERRRLVSRNKNVQHLEVMPYGASGTPSVPKFKIVPFRRVKPAVWSAFVRVDLPFSSFLNRKTGHVERRSLGCDVTTVAAPDEEDDWVQIQPIPPDRQKEWARSFIDLVPELPSDKTPLREERWWDALVNWIRETKPTAELEWKKFRTTKVIEYLHTWAKENGVQPDILFAEPATRERTESAAEPVPPAEEEQARQAILQALRAMPFSELVRLPIPVHYLLRYVSIK